MVDIPYVLATTRGEIEREAAKLGRSSAPVCIDTERAGNYKFTDNACLIQIRRGDEPVVLFDALTDPDHLAEHLGAAINDQPWIMHAGITDLPCLYELELYPSHVEDTNVAARLLNYERTNLKALTEHCTGLALEKKFAKVNWSRRPLRHEWLSYATLDVAFLEQCATQLTAEVEAQGKAEFLRQEMEYLAEEFHTFTPHEPAWHDIPGARSLEKPLQRQVLKELWLARQDRAELRDIAPHMVATNAELLELATTLPYDVHRVRAILNSMRRKGSPPVSMGKVWALSNVIQDARSAAKYHWPSKPTRATHVPDRDKWPEADRYACNAWGACQKVVKQVAAELNVQTETLESAPVLRELVWDSIHKRRYTTKEEMLEFLRESSMRPWQVDALGEQLATTLLEYQEADPRNQWAKQDGNSEQ